MIKPKLVIIHSFPTNSYILSGLYEFLADHFDLYPIDIPGFMPNTQPILDTSLTCYQTEIQKQIDCLKLDNYWIAGVSFGFVLANLCANKTECKGIVGLLPYINRDYLVIPSIEFKILQWTVILVSLLKRHKTSFHSWWFRRLLRTETTDERIDDILQTVHPYSFFELARWLCTHNDMPTFGNKPYIFLVNPHDMTIKGPKLLKLLESVKTKLIVEINADHHPDEITYEYFSKHVTKEDISKILTYIARNGAPHTPLYSPNLKGIDENTSITSPNPEEFAIE